MKVRTYYHAIFISDLHLGSRGAKAKHLLAFLKSIECKHLYLVGDVVDLWAMQRGIQWNADCTSVVRRLLKMMKEGTQVVYVIGNHDDALRHFAPLAFGNEIDIVDEAIFTTFDGKRMLIIHGDKFDFVARWLSVLGGHLYDWLLLTNNVVHSIRTLLGFRKYWSLSAYLKKRTKSALNAVKNFETVVVEYAKKQDCIGVICGHIHTAQIRSHEGMVYANCGDWVESLTAVVSSPDGKLDLIQWNGVYAQYVRDGSECGKL